MVQLSKQDVAYATPLAQYAIKQVRSGRRVGTKINIRDVSSRHAQAAKGITQKVHAKFGSSMVKQLDGREKSRNNG